MAQKHATVKRLDMSIAFQNTLMETLHQRVDTRQQAIDLNVGTKINLYDAKEELEKSQSQLASDEGQRIETDAALSQVGSERMKAVSQFIADNENKLADASRKRDEAREGARQGARPARAYETLRPDRRGGAADGGDDGRAGGDDRPAAGHDHARGRRPRGRGAGAQPRHRLRQGRAARRGQGRRLPVHPLRRLTGQVARIAPGAVAEPEAKRAMANATAAANASQPAATPAGQPESFVFPSPSPSTTPPSPSTAPASPSRRA